MLKFKYDNTQSEFLMSKILTACQLLSLAAFPCATYANLDLTDSGTSDENQIEYSEMSYSCGNSCFGDFPEDTTPEIDA